MNNKSVFVWGGRVVFCSRIKFVWRHPNCVLNDGPKGKRPVPERSAAPVLNRLRPTTDKVRKPIGSHHLNGGAGIRLGPAQKPKKGNVPPTSCC